MADGRQEYVTINGSVSILFRCELMMYNEMRGETDIYSTEHRPDTIAHKEQKSFTRLDRRACARCQVHLGRRTKLIKKSLQCIYAMGNKSTIEYKIFRGQPRLNDGLSMWCGVLLGVDAVEHEAIVDR